MTFASFAGPVMTKFTIALREIGTYKEVLRSQVENPYIRYYGSIFIKNAFVCHPSLRYCGLAMTHLPGPTRFHFNVILTITWLNSFLWLY